MKIKNKVNVLLIGYGYWGPNLARNIDNSNDYNLISICDSSKKQFSKIKKIYPKVKILDDYKKAIMQTGINLVVIATPTKTHYQIAKYALQNDKHILVEKPITQSSKELRSLYKIADKKKKEIFVDYPFLFSGASEYLKKMISSNKYGKPYSLEFIREQAPIREDCNVLWDLGIHDISILNYFFDKDLTIENKIKNHNFTKKNYDSINLFLHINNNINIQIKSAWMSPTKIRIIKVRFKEVTIICNENEPIHKIEIYKKILKNHRSNKRDLPGVDLREPLGKLLNYVFLVIKNKKKNNLINKKLNLKITKLLEKVDK